jgi:CRP-like cAMP-binding protein
MTLSQIFVLPYPVVPHFRFSKKELISLKSDILWKIESGFVRTLTWDEDGNIIALGIWGPGDIVGKPLSQIMPYQIECLTVVRAKQLPNSHHHLQQAMSIHIQQMEVMLTIAHTKQVAQRLLKLLQWLAFRFGTQVNEGWLLEIGLSHQLLSELTASTRVTITRLLRQFEAEGKIIRLGRQIVLVDSGEIN